MKKEEKVRKIICWLLLMLGGILIVISIGVKVIYADRSAAELLLIFGNVCVIAATAANLIFLLRNRKK